MRKKRFLINASITSTTSVFMNIVGVSFNVYISNKLGAQGVGLFQLIMSVYGFSVTLASSGINLAATRLVADELALNEKNAASYIMKKCLTYAAFFGFLSFILLFTFSDYIALNLLCDERTKMSLKALSISMVPIAMSSAMSGYFMGARKLSKSASAQIFEQFIKIGLSILSLEIFIKKRIEYACLCVVLCGSISEIASFLYLYVLYLFDKRRHLSKNKRKNAYIEVIKIAVPVALSAYLRSALVTIEHLLIPRGLKKSGMDSETSLKCYGTIHGMTLPIILFPSSILKSLAGLLVPEFSECLKLGHVRQINHIASRMIKNALLFSIFISGIFYCFADEFGRTIYKNSEVSYYIRLLAPLTVIMYVDGIVDGMLKGLNQQLNSMWYNIIDSFISVIAVIILLPKYGASGYIAMIYISELLNGFLSINRLIKITDFKVKYISWIALPCVLVYSLGTIARIFLKMNTLLSIFSLTLTILFCLGGYLVFLVLFSVIDISPIKKARHGFF